MAKKKSEYVGTEALEDEPKDQGEKSERSRGGKDAAEERAPETVDEQDEQAKEESEAETEQASKTLSEEREDRIAKGERRVARAEKELAEGTREDKIREGQVFDDMAADQDDPRRRVKVLAPKHDGKVLVENLSTRRLSHIAEDRLLSEAFERSV